MTQIPVEQYEQAMILLGLPVDKDGAVLISVHVEAGIAYLEIALSDADKNDVYGAAKFMHAAYEFDRMLRARRARLER